MIWVLPTLLAVIFQLARTSSQKYLQDKISISSNVFAKFVFSLPIVLPLFVFLYVKYPEIFSNLSLKFYLYCFIVAVLQIVFTLYLLYLLKRANLAVTVTFLKTEAIQAALMGYFFFHESIPLYGFLAIIISFIGVFLIAPADHKYIINSKVVSSGLICGFLSSLAGFYIKKGVLLVADASILQANCTFLVINNLIQVILLLGYFIYKGSLRKICNEQANNLKMCCSVGVYTIFAYLCWFISYSLQKVAYVKLLGQVEILVAYLIARGIFSEKISLKEDIGIFLILIGVIVVLCLSFFK